jgi:hypothetical protein
MTTKDLALISVKSLSSFLRLAIPMEDLLFYWVVSDSIINDIGGATFGRFHLGLIKALYDEDLSPE